MKFLDEISSWVLFSKIVCGKKSFPLELEEIGKRIVGNCRGLPLSIVTIGGLLARSEPTREHWKDIEENLNSIVNSKDNNFCLRTLKMSYNYLPVHLKPCFLYMGVFEEDCKIRASTLIKLWISEGFLEPASEKTLETVARENLKELIDRNLVFIHELGSSGNVRLCKIHDLLRDLCLREAEKERFYCVVRNHIPHDINSMHRVVIHRNTLETIALKALRSISKARTVICDFYYSTACEMPVDFWLLRIFKAFDEGIPPYTEWNLWSVHPKLVNMRCLLVNSCMIGAFPLQLDSLWNLKTLIFHHHFLATLEIPIEIWNMPYVRHIKFRVSVRLPDPPSSTVVIMENLQSLKVVANLQLSEEVVKRIPNIKKLGLEYNKDVKSNGDDCCLNNLERLHKLESFLCFNYKLEVHDFLKKLTFPQSLKKLTLYFVIEEFELEEILEKIGRLPLLRKLDLVGGCYGTGEWVTVEGQFRKLEFLRLDGCEGLKQWTSESSHFPLLKEVYLEKLKTLNEIPLEIGDVPTLQAIVLKKCSESAVMSAKRIDEEQEELQGEEELSFHVQVSLAEDQEALQILAGPNFEIV